MKRWHQDFRITHREWTKHRRTYHPDSACPCDDQAGRFRKTDAHDCGRARCFLCHHAKLLRQKTHEERLADVSLREQLLALRR